MRHCVAETGVREGGRDGADGGGDHDGDCRHEAKICRPVNHVWVLSLLAAVD